MSASCIIGPTTIGTGQPLAVLAGPCVLEDHQTNLAIATTIRDACRRLGFSFIFKASFDKANRSSGASPRGPGIQAGLDELARIRDSIGAPVTTDLHEPAQAAAVARAVDLLQVPAFLCRQTDLLAACASTGRPVNVKKGQFLAPQEMKHVIDKLQQASATQIMLTERGTFFGYNRLVNDFIGLGDLMELGRPVCFDITHSTQTPGTGPGATGGRPDRARLLARAAVAAGAHAVFLECHPAPAKAASDAATMQSLDAAVEILEDLAAIRRALPG